MPYLLVLDGKIQKNALSLAGYDAGWLTRQLQRQGIPFATGVLQENDVDYQVAKALAAKVVTERPFEEISEEHYQEAVELMRSCKKVILAVSGFGSMNRRNEELKKEAEKLGILEK